MSNWDRTDLSALKQCDVQEVHRRPGIGQPGDTTQCSVGHELTVGPDGHWGWAGLLSLSVANHHF